jgi:hypothetical protein
MPLPTPSFGSPEDNARHFDPAPRELVGTAFQFPWAVPAFFDDAELSGDLPEYTPGGFPDGNAFPGAIDLSFHASEVANV